jgi:hypothetical protein
VEAAILDRDRDFIIRGARLLAERRRRSRQAERVLLLVADQPKAGQPSVDVESRDAERVVVKPERFGAAVVRIFEDCRAVSHVFGGRIARTAGYIAVGNVGGRGQVPG